MALTKPIFVETDPKQIVSEMVAYYEDSTGKKLQPAQIETLIFNSFAYRENIIRNAINNAAVQNLVAFATAPALDYLAEIVGVVRIPAVPAQCVMSLQFVGNTTAIVIPEGTRIAAKDQKVFFRTIQTVGVPANTETVEVTAVCDTDGLDGNGYAPGDINIIQDPQPYLSAALNLDETVGGAVEESDAQLRERIKLAPASFSNAGSKGAYKFFALSAHPSIVFVTVKSSVPGQVDIFPLIDSGDVTPIEILNAVEATCNDEKVRPLTDTVVVTSPARVTYSLTVHLTLFETAIQVDTVQSVEDNLNEFITEKRKKLGNDIKKTQVIAAIMKNNTDNIYDVDLPGFVDISIDDQSFAFCTVFAVTVTGTNPG